jgi:hypothetical protein
MKCPLPDRGPSRSAAHPKCQSPRKCEALVARQSRCGRGPVAVRTDAERATSRRAAGSAVGLDVGGFGFGQGFLDVLRPGTVAVRKKGTRDVPARSGSGAVGAFGEPRSRECARNQLRPRTARAPGQCADAPQWDALRPVLLFHPIGQSLVPFDAMALVSPMPLESPDLHRPGDGAH